MPDNWKQCAVLWGFNLNKKITMYINNLPFPETLHMAQRDIYDIDTMLLTPLKKQKKSAKRRKNAWYLLSGFEHAVGITFGVLAIIDAYNQRYIMSGFNTGLLTIGALLAFNAANSAKSYADTEQQLKTEIQNIENAVNCALPEQLHEIAEIVRNQNYKQK